MPENVLIILAIGAIIVPLAKIVPLIIWSIRCPANSKGYTQPPIFRPLPSDERKDEGLPSRH